MPLDMKAGRIILLLVLAALVFPGCRGQRGAQPRPRPRAQQEAVRELRNFSYPDIPAVLTDPEQRQDFFTEHFWDLFFGGDGPCDTGAVLGVPYADVERQVALYVQLLQQMPLPRAQEKMGRFFRQVEERQAADTASHVFLLMEEIVSRYLYDPDSPVRDEDLYLPYVQGLAASRFTREEARPAYVYESRMCALAPRGSIAPDFRFRDLAGRSRRLSDVRAEASLLFFSNPGCSACAEIVNTLEGLPGLSELIRSGKLAILSIYIDEDLEAWREYAPNYPRGWLCGYDPDGIIREERLYNVRAIPSLYLLDADKRILMKDAPTERVVNWLETIINK